MDGLLSTLRVGEGKSLRTKVTLFRRDNMKSVCIFCDVRLQLGPISANEETIHVLCRVTRRLSFGKDGAGYRAECMMRERNPSHALGVFVTPPEIVNRPLLPLPGSKEEPSWLVNFRKSSQDENDEYRPSNDDMDALSKMGTFEFGLQSIKVGFSCIDHVRNIVTSFASEEDLMISIEGLRWA